MHKIKQNEKKFSKAIDIDNQNLFIRERHLMMILFIRETSEIT